MEDSIEYITEWPPQEDLKYKPTYFIKKIDIEASANKSNFQHKLISDLVTDSAEENSSNIVDDSEDENCEVSMMALITLARWKKNVNPSVLNSMSHLSNPITQLYQLSRSEEAKTFLKDKIKTLSYFLKNVKSHRKAASFLATLASYHDILGNYKESCDLLIQAIHYHPLKKYKWLLAKMQKQIDVKIKQQDSLNKVKEIFHPYQVKSVIPLERISANDLTVKEFHKNYSMKGIPVVITDAVSQMTDVSWNLNHISKVAGDKIAILKKLVPESVEWARLEPAAEMKISDFIHEIQNSRKDSKEKLYLFDWSLPVHCPELSSQLRIPEYFTDDYLKKTHVGSLYRDSWPSLFVAPSGVKSDLHVDAFSSNFWMALFQGKKRWIFFSKEDIPFLYPTYFHSMDPVFEANPLEPDLENHPLLALTHARECILCPGEILFVPAGSPHQVENLETSVAVSSNFVNESNIDSVVKELEINSLICERTADLLLQFRQLSLMKEKFES